jgi:hypothetical protein
MADEIPFANIVRVYRNGPEGDPHEWVAVIGPDEAQGITARGPSAASALLVLACRAVRLRWPFDAGWKPR